MTKEEKEAREKMLARGLVPRVVATGQGVRNVDNPAQEKAARTRIADRRKIAAERPNMKDLFADVAISPEVEARSGTPILHRQAMGEYAAKRAAQIMAGLKGQPTGVPVSPPDFRGVASPGVERFGPQAGSIAPEAIAQRRLADYQRFGANNGVVLRTPPARQQALASVPDAPNPLDGARLTGHTLPGAKQTFGPGEVSPPVPVAGAAGAGQMNVPDPGVAQAARDRMQAMMNDRKMLADRIQQSNDARAKANSAGFVRPTVADNNQKRYDKRVERFRQMQAAQMEPAIALAEAEHGMTPDRKAMADYHNAMANKVKLEIALAQAQMGPSGPQPGAPPGMGPQPSRNTELGLDENGKPRGRYAPGFLESMAEAARRERARQAQSGLDYMQPGF